MNVKYDRAVSDFTHWDLTAASLWPWTSVSCHQDTEWHIFFLPLAVAACTLLNMPPLSLSSTALTLYGPYATWKLNAMSCSWLNSWIFKLVWCVLYRSIGDAHAPSWARRVSFLSYFSNLQSRMFQLAPDVLCLCSSACRQQMWLTGGDCVTDG